MFTGPDKDAGKEITFGREKMFDDKEMVLYEMSQRRVSEGRERKVGLRCP